MRASIDKSLGFILESQKIATQLLKSLEATRSTLVESDHLDFVLQTNLLSFLILWKAKRYEECQQYVPLCDKLIR